MQQFFRLGTLSRLAAILVVFGGLLVSGGRSARAGENEPPATGSEQPIIYSASANGPQTVTIAWTHTGDGVVNFNIEEKSHGVLPYSNVSTVEFDSHGGMVTGPPLQASMTYQFRVCAVYVSNQVCSDYSPPVKTPMSGPAQASTGSNPLPPIITGNDSGFGSDGNPWIGLSWETAGHSAEYNYDYYEIHYEVKPASGTWQDPGAPDRAPKPAPDPYSGYHQVGNDGRSNLLPGTIYLFAIEGCIHIDLGLLKDKCDQPSSAYEASTPGRVGDEWRTKWHMLDNNPATKDIVADGGHLYQLWSGGQIWQYTGTGAECQASPCPGWTQLDANPLTAQIAAGGGHLYQRWSGGQVWEYTGTGAKCQASPCPGWTQLDSNQFTADIVAGDHLYQRWSGGQVWEYTGTGAACQASPCPGWTQLDANQFTAELAAGGGHLYQRWSGGQVWEYTGTGAACQASPCPGWTQLDSNQFTADIVAGDHLYQRWSGGQVWEYTGTGAACQASPCPGWTQLDTNQFTSELAAAGGHLYQRWSGGQIWQYTGTGAKCQVSPCPGWQQFDDNSGTIRIAAAGDDLYQLHSDGSIYKHTK